MSKNINQVYIANPITSNASTDLMYFGQSPYGLTNDAAMTYANFSAQFGAPYTAAALTKTDDTNVTLTLGGTPATALLQATSITAGWTGTLSGTRGGTGVNNGSNTITIGGNISTANSFTTSGNFAVTQTYTNTTNVTFPTSGTLATTSQLLASPLTTKGDLWGWTSTNARIAVGTTNGQILQVSSGAAAGLAYSTPTYPSASGSAGVILRSDGTNNIYTTSTFADTYAVSTILYASGSNAVTGLATTNNAAMTTTSGGVPQWLALTDGQIVIGSSAGAPTAATITAGTGISVTNGHNTITIANTGVSGTTNVNQNSSTVTLAAASRYAINNGASLVTLTIPAGAAVGDTYMVVGGSSGGWTVAQPASVQCHLGNTATTSGAGGSLSSSNQYDCLTITCVASNVFTVYGVQGNITIV